MRTRSNVYFGSGIEGAIRIIKNLYPAGKVRVVAEESSDGEYFCERLTEEGYLAEAVLPDRQKNDDAFLLGVGGENVIFSVKKQAKNKYAFCPTTLLPDLFLPAENGVFAEFSYFDTDFFTGDNEAMVAECYAGLFCALTEALAFLYAEKKRPFCDKSLKNDAIRSREILLGKSDREVFLNDCVFAVKDLTERLFDRGNGFNCAVDMAKQLGGGIKNRNISAYFLNRLLILFTKWNFRDMLIATENTAVFSSAYEEEDLLLKGSDLSIIAAKIKDDVLNPGLHQIVAAMKSAVFQKNGLFCEIFSRGLPEGLIGYG